MQAIQITFGCKVLKTLQGDILLLVPLLIVGVCHLVTFVIETVITEPRRRRKFNAIPKPVQWLFCPNSLLYHTVNLSCLLF